MRAVLLEVPEALLEERRKAGLDVWDEIWDGVLHMVPPPPGLHQRFALRLGAALLPLADSRGLVSSHETALYRPGHAGPDFRVPDLVFARPANATERGVEGRAELVVEVLSPGDETYDKLDFYAEVAVQELVVADPEACTVELFVLRGGRLHAALPDSTGSLSVGALGVSLSTVAGPALRLRWAAGTIDITGRT